MANSIKSNSTNSFVFKTSNTSGNDFNNSFFNNSFIKKADEVVYTDEINNSQTQNKPEITLEEYIKMLKDYGITEEDCNRVLNKEISIDELLKEIDRDPSKVRTIQQNSFIKQINVNSRYQYKDYEDFSNVVKIKTDNLKNVVKTRNDINDSNREYDELMWICNRLKSGEDYKSIMESVACYKYKDEYGNVVYIYPDVNDGFLNYNNEIFEKKCEEVTFEEYFKDSQLLDELKQTLKEERKTTLLGKKDFILYTDTKEQNEFIESIQNKYDSLYNNRKQQLDDLDSKISIDKKEVSKLQSEKKYVDDQVEYYIDNIHAYTSQDNFLGNCGFNDKSKNVLNEQSYKISKDKSKVVDLYSCIINGELVINNGILQKRDGTYFAEVSQLGSIDNMMDNYVKWLPFVSDTEKQIFNYILNTEGYLKAYKYLENISDELDNRWLANKCKEDKEFAQEHEIIASIGSIFVTPVEGINAAAYTLNSKLTGEKIRRSDVYSAGNIWRQSVSEELHNYNSTWGFIYDTGMSMADSGLLIAASAITGGSAAPILSAFLMGSRAYVSTLNDALDRGLSDNQAILLAASSAIVETAMESYSVGHLMNLEEKLGEGTLKIISNATKNIDNKTVSNLVEKSLYIMLSSLSQGIAEGEEEFCTEVLNYAADIFIAKDLSNYSQSIENYLAQGKTEDEAVLLTMKDFGGQTIQAFIGGFASGICFGAFGSANSTIKTSYGISNGMYNQFLGENVSFSEAIKFNQQQISDFQDAIELKNSGYELSQNQENLLKNGTIEQQSGNIIKDNIKENSKLYKFGKSILDDVYFISEKAKLVTKESISNKITTMTYDTLSNPNFINFINSPLSSAILTDPNNSLKYVGVNILDKGLKILFNKRAVLDVKKDVNMTNKIKEEGLIHFASESNVDSIIDSKVLYGSKKFKDRMANQGVKTFFFAGNPTFEEMLLNVNLDKKMTAVRIKPTDSQINELGFRVFDDNAIIHDGDFDFTENQSVEKVYYGLVKDEKGFHYKELSKSEYDIFESNVSNAEFILANNHINQTLTQLNYQVDNNNYTYSDYFRDIIHDTKNKLLDTLNNKLETIKDFGNNFVSSFDSLIPAYAFVGIDSNNGVVEDLEILNIDEVSVDDKNLFSKKSLENMNIFDIANNLKTADNNQISDFLINASIDTVEKTLATLSNDEINDFVSKVRLSDYYDFYKKVGMSNIFTELTEENLQKSVDLLMLNPKTFALMNNNENFVQAVANSNQTIINDVMSSEGNDSLKSAINNKINENNSINVESNSKSNISDNNKVVSGVDIDSIKLNSVNKVSDMDFNSVEDLKNSCDISEIFDDSKNVKTIKIGNYEIQLTNSELIEDLKYRLSSNNFSNNNISDFGELMYYLKLYFETNYNISLKQGFMDSSFENINQEYSNMLDTVIKVSGKDISVTNQILDIINNGGNESGPINHIDYSFNLSIDKMNRVFEMFKNLDKFNNTQYLSDMTYEEKVFLYKFMNSGVINTYLNMITGELKAIDLYQTSQFRNFNKFLDTGINNSDIDFQRFDNFLQLLMERSKLKETFVLQRATTVNEFNGLPIDNLVGNIITQNRYKSSCLQSYDNIGTESGGTAVCADRDAIPVKIDYVCPEGTKCVNLGMIQGIDFVGYNVENEVLIGKNQKIRYDKVKQIVSEDGEVSYAVLATIIPDGVSENISIKDIVDSDTYELISERYNLESSGESLSVENELEVLNVDEEIEIPKIKDDFHNTKDLFKVDEVKEKLEVLEITPNSNTDNVFNDFVERSKKGYSYGITSQQFENNIKYIKSVYPKVYSEFIQIISLCNSANLFADGKSLDINKKNNLYNDIKKIMSDDYKKIMYTGLDNEQVDDMINRSIVASIAVGMKINANINKALQSFLAGFLFNRIISEGKNVSFINNFQELEIETQKIFGHDVISKISDAVNKGEDLMPLFKDLEMVSSLNNYETRILYNYIEQILKQKVAYSNDPELAYSSRNTLRIVSQDLMSDPLELPKTGTNDWIKEYESTFVYQGLLLFKDVDQVYDAMLSTQNISISESAKNIIQELKEKTDNPKEFLKGNRKSFENNDIYELFRMFKENSEINSKISANIIKSAFSSNKDVNSCFGMFFE